MKIRPVAVDLFHTDRQADRQTDLTKQIVAFRNFTNAPEKWDIQETVDTRNMDRVELTYKAGRAFVQKGMNFNVS